MGLEDDFNYDQEEDEYHEIKDYEERSAHMAFIDAKNLSGSQGIRIGYLKDFKNLRILRAESHNPSISGKTFKRIVISSRTNL